jgi:hypothetical protein
LFKTPLFKVLNDDKHGRVKVLSSLAAEVSIYLPVLYGLTIFQPSRDSVQYLSALNLPVLPRVLQQPILLAIPLKIMVVASAGFTGVEMGLLPHILHCTLRTLR